MKILSHAMLITLVSSCVGFAQDAILENKAFETLKKYGAEIRYNKARDIYRISDLGDIPDEKLNLLEPLLYKITMIGVGDRKTKLFMNQVKKINRLEVIFLENNNLNDDDLLSIRKLSFINTLGLKNNKINGEGFKILNELSEIKTIDLSGNPINDDNLKYFTHLKKLRIINLNNTPVTDKALDIISNYETRELVVVTVIGTKVTKKAAERFYKTRGVEACINSKDCHLY